MAANYACLLFDVDGTLLDFSAAEREAIAGTLQHFNLDYSEASVLRFSEINASLWAALEQGEIKKEKLVVQRFAQLLEQLGVQGDPVAMNNEFMTRLSSSAHMMPGADELLAELAEFCTLAVVSNGVQKVQEKRLTESGLLPFFDGVYVSEKMGATKPSPKIFDRALKNLGIKNKERVLVVGDSLTADIKGGQNAGLKTCWCNFKNEQNETGIEPTHTIQSFTELKLVAVGEEELKLSETREKRHTDL